MTVKTTDSQSAAEAAFSGRPYLMRVTDVAEVLGISRASVYRLIESGQLAASRPVLTGAKGSVRVVRDSATKLMAEWLKETF
jgi:excisionase family DNA binding protein